MKPIKFPEQNIVYGANQPEYEPLPALSGGGPQGQVVTCWQMSWRELWRLIRGGRKVWLSVYTFHHPIQPLYMTTSKTDIIGKRGEEESK